MKTKMSQFLKSIIVLAVIAVFSGLLIGLIRQFTIIDSDEQQRKIINKLAPVYAVSDLTEIEYTSSNGSLQGNIDGFYNAKNSTGEDVYIVVSRGTGYSANLQMYLVIKEKSIVALLQGSNTETPSISEKAFNQTYFSQYLGKNLEEIYPFVLSDEGESGVDAASGATYTSKGITEAVNNGVAYYLEYMNNGGSEIVYLSDVYSIQSLNTILFESTDETLNDKMDALYEGKNANGETIYLIISRAKGRKDNLQMYTVLKNNVVVAMKEGTNAETIIYNGVEYSPKVFNQEFYNQFIGKNISELYPFINEDSDSTVDIVSGATQTSNGVIKAVKNGLKFYLEYLEGIQ